MMAAQAKDANCIFCKIISAEVASPKLVDNDFCIAIKDLNPQAPTHILVIPKEHIPDVRECADEHLLGKLFQQAGQIASENSLSKGFRLVVNTGDEGGQTVHHLHIHILGGRSMRWPPG